MSEGKKVPSDPDFDYDLWIEGGKKFMRIKATRESCGINDETFRLLSAELMRIKREKDPNIGRKPEERKPIVKVVSFEKLGGKDWFPDGKDYSAEVDAKILQEKFAEILTDKQRDIYLECIVFGMSYTEYARKHGISESAVRGAISRLREQAKKFFGL